MSWTVLKDMASGGFSPETALRKPCFTCKRYQHDKSREGRICCKCTNNFHIVCFEKTSTGQIQCSNCTRAEENPSQNSVDQIVYYLASDLAHPRELDMWKYHITSDKKRVLMILKWMVFYKIHRIGKDMNLVNRLQILKSRLGVFKLDPEREEYKLFGGKVASYISSMAINFKKQDILREDGDGTVTYHPETQKWLLKDWNGEWMRQKSAWTWANPPAMPQHARKRARKSDSTQTPKGKRPRVSSVPRSLFENGADPSEPVAVDIQQEDIRAQRYPIADSNDGVAEPSSFNQKGDDITAYMKSKEELDSVRNQISKLSDSIAAKLQNAQDCVGSYRILETLDLRLPASQSQYYAEFDAIYQKLYAHDGTAPLSATIARDFDEMKKLRDREKQLEHRHEEIIARTRVTMEHEIQYVESLLKEIPLIFPIAQTPMT